VVVVETVGVGQSEVEIAKQADTTIVVLAPGMGDAVQAAKAGILEIADIFVVNKSDRDGAQALVRELRTMIALADRGPQDWKSPIVMTVAYQNRGIGDLLEAIDKFRASQTETGRAALRRIARARREVESIALARVRAEFRLNGEAGLEDLAMAVSRGELDPYAAADRVVVGS
ncbi:MAG TPA: methylmalonyl Co-A mutase-associated GTPase MeaB, partial [Propionibacteriaceae bacterium]|nr:methylmalonyl Co-A mutase-associated GTPase MeaB [Propionibacteriaceae bacterium]